MLRAQHESTNDLKKMITLLLTNSKKSKGSKTDTSSSKSRGKQKEGESSTFENIESENNFGYENLKYSSEEERNS